MNLFGLAKKIVKWVSVFVFALLIIFTIDVINEEPNWAVFDIDFKNSTVSNYGTLISGILSFLAILFVIYGLLEQRETMLNEKIEKQQDLIEDYKSRLNLLNTFLKNILNEVKLQGERMEEFYKKELENPSQTHSMHFSANYSFQRVFEMDTLVNYKAIKYFFKEENEWEKLFLNLNNYVDFYSESLKEHQQKYISHIKDKVQRQEEIGKLCKDFLDVGSKLIESYKVEYGTDKYLSRDWVIAVNEFIPAYYAYINECTEKKEQTNFRILSDNYFYEFLLHSMEIRDKEGFDNFGSQELVGIASNIRKKIFEIEMYSNQYAENIEYYFKEYFSTETESYKNFQVIQNKIEAKSI